MEDDNTAPSMIVGVPTTDLPSTQIQNDNSNKKILICKSTIYQYIYSPFIKKIMALKREIFP